ncbi:hypothetical protein BH09BAC5_BH09BAC5_23200 [soil metagenome]
MEQDNGVEAYQETIKEQRKHPLFALIPKGDYFFTPIILNINILVFVLMIISGVSPMLPNAEELINWGANVRKLTMGGEPWRLFTSMFLHFGILHLATNMYAFFSIGRILEPFIGKWRFLFLYIFAGLGGSAVSLWWHAADASVSAGASGAIFGLFGVFAALLTTDLIDQSIRKRMLKSMAGAIFLNLMIGLYGGIDNSAHIGGLVTGAAGGYLCYFDLRDWYRKRILHYRGVIFTGILTAGMIVFFWMIILNNLPPDNEELFTHFSIEEKKSLDFIDKIDSSTTADAILKNAVEPWKHCVSIADSMNQNGMTDKGKLQIKQLKLYAVFRLRGSDALYRSVKNGNKDLYDSAKIYMQAADHTVLSLKDENDEK